MKIRKMINRLIGMKNKAYSKKNRASRYPNAIIVGGLGRCGTKLICKSLKKSGILKNKTFLDRIDEQKEYINGFYYKTHDYPPDNLPANVKLIYMFGNPMNTAISAHKQINEWGYLHHYHLNSDLYKFNNDVFYNDTLLLHKHFDAWYKEQNFEFISIKYEALYDQRTAEILNHFLGFQISLIPFAKRESDYKTHPQKEHLIKTYGELNEKIKRAENVRVWEPKMPKIIPELIELNGN
jgi:hypothetical protein